MLDSMAKRPTLRDVADAVGLAPATVSYALRGERGCEGMRAIAQAFGRLAYPKHGRIGSALASGRSRTVAVLCGSTRDLWQQSLVSALARELMAQGRHAIVADADGHPEREEALLSKLRAQRPDGLLVAPLDPFASLWEDVASNLPVVAIGDRLPLAPSAGAVVFDNATGVAAVFEHITGLGHRRILVVLPQRPSTPDRPAEELVAAQAKRYGVSVTLLHAPPATSDEHAATAHIASALVGSQAPTAVFCLTDSFAFATLRAARALGLSVPRDLSVAGFEDVAFADLAGPGLTTVNWGSDAPVHAVVRAAVGQLLAAIDDDEPPTTVTIGPRLIVRGTTGAAKPAP
jgi:DNA-binding LacI/PurR family transcriptional regulator